MKICIDVIDSFLNTNVVAQDIVKLFLKVIVLGKSEVH